MIVKAIQNARTDEIESAITKMNNLIKTKKSKYKRTQSRTKEVKNPPDRSAIFDSLAHKA